MVWGFETSKSTSVRCFIPTQTVPPTWNQNSNGQDYRGQSHSNHHIIFVSQCVPQKNKWEFEGFHLVETPLKLCGVCLIHQCLINAWWDSVTLTGKNPEMETLFCFLAGVSWDSLPDELLLGIFSCLCLPELLRVSGVCKRWYRLS